MKNSKYEILNTKQIRNTNPSNSGHSILFSISLLVFSIYALSLTPALAMGSAPKKEEPKYKVEILKMEIVSQPATKEVSKTKKSNLKK
jgi:hypothetical protein